MSFFGNFYTYFTTQGLNWRDLLDMGIVAVLLYQVMQMVRGTRVLAILVGFFSLSALYYISRWLGLYTLTWLLQHVFSSLFLVLVIIFKNDIRQWLTEMGSRSLWRRQNLHEAGLEELIQACVEMAYLRVGALIIIQRTVPLKDMIEREAVPLDAKISRQLLLNIFYPKAPLHDGAIVINEGRIEAAACILPLAEAHGQDFGTRHRAALGATLESDAVAVVVSEERGEISMATKGALLRNLDAATLRKELRDVFK